MVNDGTKEMNPQLSSQKDPGLEYAASGGIGISHGLKTVHRTVFLTAFRFLCGKK